MADPIARGRVLRRMTVLLVALALLGMYRAVGGRIAAAPWIGDFYKFHLSGERLQRGEGMYWDQPDRSTPGAPCHPAGDGDLERAAKPDSARSLAELRECLHPNLNPPFFAVLVRPVALLDYAGAWWAWAIASFACATAAMVLLQRTLAPASGWFAALAATTALLAWFPTFATFVYGQVTMFLLLPLVLGWRAMRAGRDAEAGAWMGLAASLKPFVGLFLVALVLARRPRSVAGFAAAGAAALVAGGLIAGFPAYRAYLDTLGEVSWLSASWNASFAGFFARIFGGSDNVPWIQAPWLARALSGACAVATLATMYVALKRAAALGPRVVSDTLMSLTLPAMLLLSPLGWVYYFPLLAVAGALVWNAGARLPSRRLVRLLLLATLAVTIVPRPLAAASDLDDPLTWFVDAGGYCFALAGLFVIAAWVALRRGDSDVRAVTSC